MGGYGSGSWQRPTHELVEHSGQVCVWEPASYLLLHKSERTGEALLCPEREFFRAMLWHFQPTRTDGQRVALVASDGTLGGVRWWFECPECQRRCAKLYRPRTRSAYACRGCARVNYTCQRESNMERLGRRADKLYRRVSVRDGRGRRQKRPWVRHRTYRQTLECAARYDRAWGERLDERVKRLFLV